MQFSQRFSNMSKVILLRVFSSKFRTSSEPADRTSSWKAQRFLLMQWHEFQKAQFQKELYFPLLLEEASQYPKRNKNIYS